MKKADQPTTRNIKIKTKAEECCCNTEEPAVSTAEVPETSPQTGWQKEEPPYTHRDIF